MPRPRKAGLEYFYKGVHEWDEIEMIELLQRYGPLGYTVYEAVLSKIYENGYYLEIPLDRLAVYVVRTVGNRWIREKSLAVQVIQYCAEIGLFDRALLRQGVVTSASIQQHYAEVTARSKADKSRYWLLDEPAEGRRHLPAGEVSAAKTEVITAKTPEKTAKKPQSKEKQSKQNKMKVKQSKAKAEEREKKKEKTAAAAPPGQVEKIFFTVSGRAFRPSDMEALEEMHACGADDSLIMKIIRDVAKRGQTEIISMKYFLPIVKEAMQKNKDSPKGFPSSEEPMRYADTFDTQSIENVLDQEWQREISKYAPMSEADYV